MRGQKGLKIKTEEKSNFCLNGFFKNYVLVVVKVDSLYLNCDRKSHCRDYLKLKIK